MQFHASTPDWLFTTVAALIQYRRSRSNAAVPVAGDRYQHGCVSI